MKLKSVIIPGLPAYRPVLLAPGAVAPLSSFPFPFLRFRAGPSFPLLFALCWLAASWQPTGLARAQAATAPVSEALSASEMVTQIGEIALDPALTYQVRDLTLRKDEIKIYFNEGYLIFSRPVAGRPIAAIFAGLDEPADGEVVLIPPTRGERQSLSKFTGTPNMDEHFQSALLAFTDGSAEELLNSIALSGRGVPAPEAAASLVERWNPVVQTVTEGLAQRLVSDLLTDSPIGGGLLFAAVAGVRLGNFDVLYDPLNEEEVTVGQLDQREGRLGFDVWTSFPSRAVRFEGAEPARLRYAMDDFRIEAFINGDLWLEATTKAKLVIHEEPARVLSFGISRVERVTAARIDGVEAELLFHESIRRRAMRPDENDVFLVVAPQPLEPGSEHEIEFEHEGAVIIDHGNAVYSVGARSNWYPRAGIDFASYDLTFQYPNNLTLAAAGEVLEDGLTAGDDPGWHRTRVRTTVPVRLAGFNLGNYKTITDAAGDLVVEVFGNRGLDPALAPPVQQTIIPDDVRNTTRGSRRRVATTTFVRTPVPPDPTARMEAVAEDVGASLAYYSELFGPPPLERLTVSPIPGTSGQGFPGLIYLSTLSYLDPGERPVAARDPRTEVFFSDLMVAHEVAHQWWGNTTTGETYRDEWIMEGLAHYSALLWLEKKQGTAAMQRVLNEFRGDLLANGDDGKAIEAFGPMSWGYRLDSAEARVTGRLITYQKGAWVFHMLRRRLGDERFFALLTEMRTRYEFRTISTDELRELAKEFLPEGVRGGMMDLFFENWVDSTGVPQLRVRFETSGQAPRIQVNGTVEQSRVPEDFSVEIPIAIETPAGRQVVWVASGDDPEAFAANVDAAPARVQIDLDSILAVAP